MTNLLKEMAKRLWPRRGAPRLHVVAKQRVREFVRKQRHPKSIFREVYLKSRWGGDGGFYSGTGSHDSDLVEPYVETVRRHLQSSAKRLRIVDLGCGDFNVGSRFLDLCSEYVAVDIVPELIAFHQRKEWGLNVRFMCLNIIDDELPSGDVCFVRQVLQHLSNSQIVKVLPKLEKYREVFITEHHPDDSRRKAYNLDKTQGGDIRVVSGSGVYLERPPFNLEADRLQLELEVPYRLGGFIRTFKYSVATWREASLPDEGQESG